MNMERGDASRPAVFVVPLQTLNASCVDAPPLPGLLLSRGFSRWAFPRYAAGESGFGEKITPYFFTIIVFESHSFEKKRGIFLENSAKICRIA